MAMAKRISVNSDTTGRITTSNIKGLNKSHNKVVEVRRSVRALYPLEPTTISESQLDSAIMSAMNKRLRSEK